MFVEVNKSNFPLVIIKFGAKIENYEDLNIFFDKVKRSLLLAFFIY